MPKTSLATKIEIMHIRDLNEKKYIVGLDLNFAWLAEEIESVKRLWTGGYHLSDIAASVRRRDIEVFLLLHELLEQGRMEPRQGNILGWRGADA